MLSNTDMNFVRAALSLARRGLGRTSPNPTVGCIVVKLGVIVGRGRTADGGRPHAETIALKAAGSEARRSTVYITLEPCNHHGQTPPCSEALIKANVRRVVIACKDPDPRTAGAGIKALQDAGINVVYGVLEQDAIALNDGFFKALSDKRPHVTLKCAVSADAKIAEAQGQRSKITGERAQAHTHLLRSQHDVILIGAETQRVDSPLLTTRIDGYDHKSKRIVLGKNVEIDGKTVDIDPHNLTEVLTYLAEQHGVRRLLVEGGARIYQSFLDADVCDEFYLYRAPHNIGESGVSALPNQDIFKIAPLFDLEHYKTMSLGEDMLEIYQRKA